MKILLDTHIALWAISGDAKLPEKAYLPIYNEHVSLLETLVFDDEGKNIEHHDPFDRILIAQAKAEGMLLLSSDRKLPYYHESCIVTV
jgi:PIN domain nuclease of toxin-antitoxin system